MAAPENAFEQGIEGGEDDPFAGADLEFEQEGEPMPEGEPPIVNANGERIDPAVTDGAPAADPPASPASGATQEPQQEASPAAQDAPAPAASPESSSPSTASATTPESESPTVHPDNEAMEIERAAAAAADVDPPEAPAPTGGETTAQSAEPSGSEETDEQTVTSIDGAPAPTEQKDGKGVVTHRNYLILTPDGDGVWREVHWYVDKDDKMVKKGTAGAKKQRLALCRGQEDALSIGYAALGEPDGGAKLVAIAETYFQPKHVEPEAPQPKRQKLKFR